MSGSSLKGQKCSVGLGGGEDILDYSTGLTRKLEPTHRTNPQNQPTEDGKKKNRFIHRLDVKQPSSECLESCSQTN